MSTTNEEPFERGLSHLAPGEGIEVVETKSTKFRLLLGRSDLEVVEVQIRSGKRFMVVPYSAEGSEGAEYWYVLSGTLRAERPGTVMELAPGSSLIADGLSAPVVFVAQGDVRLLYTTSRPSFHEMSEAIGDLMRLAVEVEMKDGYTAEHCGRIRDYSVKTGEVLGLPHSRLYNLHYGAYLHDVGKVKVPEAIIAKPGPLTDDEWVVMKRHPTYGREMLQETFMSGAGPIIEQHHERSDGSGYPLGLSGDNILVESAIVAVADTFDAMTTDRPYRKGLAPEIAFDELRKYAGVHYPQSVVEAFVSMIAH